MIKLTINEIAIDTPEGASVLQAAQSAGIRIPTLCYHKDLAPYGACRLCLVEVTAGARTGLHASCLLKAVDGLVVKTDTDRVRRARNVVFELLLARSPRAEKLVSLAKEYGVTGTRISRDHPENCILCGMCERACAQISQRHAISFAYRGTRRRIQTPYDDIASTCIGCGACAYVCPTGTIRIEPADTA